MSVNCATVCWIHVNMYLKTFEFVGKKLRVGYKKKSNQPKISRPPCSTSAEPLGVEDPLLKTSTLRVSGVTQKSQHGCNEVGQFGSGLLMKLKFCGPGESLSANEAFPSSSQAGHHTTIKAHFNLVLIKVQEVEQRRSPTYLQARPSPRRSLEAISTSGLEGWI